MQPKKVFTDPKTGKLYRQVRKKKELKDACLFFNGSELIKVQSELIDINRSDYKNYYLETSRKDLQALLSRFLLLEAFTCLVIAGTCTLFITIIFPSHIQSPDKVFIFSTICSFIGYNIPIILKK